MPQQTGREGSRNGVGLRREARAGRCVSCIVERPPHVEAMLAAVVDRTPAALALLDGKRRLTYAELDRRAHAVAGAFAAAGVQARGGKIRVRGPQVSPGYWNRPAATAEALHDGFWRSGCIGSLDADGWLKRRDRRRHVINRRALLSDCKLPDFITFLAEALPRKANGKALKPLLRERRAREAAKASPSFQAAQDVSRGVEGRQT